MNQLFDKIADIIVEKHLSIDHPVDDCMLALIVDCCYEVATGESPLGIIHDVESGESFSDLINSIHRRIEKRNEIMLEGFKIAYEHPETNIQLIKGGE